jgi:hypothetical protein
MQKTAVCYRRGRADRAQGSLKHELAIGVARKRCQDIREPADAIVQIRRVLICGEFCGFGFLSFLIRKLISIVTAIAAAIPAAIPAAIAAAIIAARAPTATIDTARRRRRRSIAAGRRNIDLAAAAAPVIAAAPIPDGTIATGEEAKCFGLGRNGGSSECESRRGHDSYPAEFQHHDTSPVIYLR